MQIIAISTNAQFRKLKNMSNTTENVYKYTEI